MPARMKNASASHMLLPLLRCLASQVYFFLVQNLQTPDLPPPVMFSFRQISVIISIKKEVYNKSQPASQPPLDGADTTQPTTHNPDTRSRADSTTQGTFCPEFR